MDGIERAILESAASIFEAATYQPPKPTVVPMRAMSGQDTVPPGYQGPRVRYSSFMTRGSTRNLRDW